MKSIRNRFLSLAVDSRGRLVSLKNRATGTELIAHRAVAEAWRLVVQSGRHTLDLLSGSSQEPPVITVGGTPAGRTLTIAYEELRAGREALPIAARFIWELDPEQPIVRARV